MSIRLALIWTGHLLVKVGLMLVLCQAIRGIAGLIPLTDVEIDGKLFATVNPMPKLAAILTALVWGILDVVLVLREAVLARILIAIPACAICVLI